MADLTLLRTAQAAGTPGYFDLVMGDTGDLPLTTGPDAIGQAIHQRLVAWVDDFFLDMATGVLTTNALGQRGGLTDAFEAVLQSTVIETPGVLSLLSWSASLDAKTRRLSVAFEAQVTGGLVTFNAPIDVTGAA